MTDATPGTRAHYVVVGDGALALRLTRALGTRFRGTVAVLVPDRTSRYAQQMADLPAVEVLEAARVDEGALTAAGADRALSAALVDQDDGGNVALALLLREKWPRLHVVVRIFDESLGRHLERDRCTVLSSSAFAAPEIVAAALRRQIRLPVHHRRLVTVTDDEEALPARMVLFATAADGAVVTLPSDVEGPHLTPKVLLADAAEDDVLPEVRADLEPDEDEVDPHRHRRLREYLRSLTITSGRNLLIAAGVLVVVVLLGAVTIRLATGSSWADALYEAVLPSLAGSDPDHEAVPVVKATQVALTVVSVAVIPWVTGVVVDGVVRTRRLLDTGAPLHRMSGHVVVVGMGDLGTRIVRSLDRRGVPVVAVDVDEAARGIAVARARDVPVVIGDARRATTLRSAYVGAAQAIVVVTSGGATTIGVGFAARSVPRAVDAPPLRTVLRVYDRDLSRRIRREVPDSVGLSSSFLAAPWFAAAMIGQEVKATIPYRDRVLVLAEIEVGEHSRLVGRHSAELDVPGAGPGMKSRLLAVRTLSFDSGGGGHLIEPAAGRYLQPGDRVYVVATTAGLQHVREQARAGTGPGAVTLRSGLDDRARTGPFSGPPEP
ncbi:NAD-binding protein [Promicromonospora thailandica]|uniref:Trk K+ transport system, NAD-binding component n=1 Tax=Promicromonospora thailandica TaxID=765201 RepID=A0A9X2G2N2_9MICO|nr:NAD-binding protein [Promicromonospora thailandica]MCP2265739.1 Trk K+ transport system, NAD-binding component [Promicromonospora thailandica]BFF21753.1 NAD-binding protein [Promicromonospora thailandica]